MTEQEEILSLLDGVPVRMSTWEGVSPPSSSALPDAKNPCNVKEHCHVETV